MEPDTTHKHNKKTYNAKKGVLKMSKKIEVQQHQFQSNINNRAYSDYRSAKQESKKSEARFSSVTKYLKGKETRLLKNDLGFFEFPETWDLWHEDGNVKR
jgi:hypothetical protein